DGTGIIDLYDYDRACLTDEDRAWVDLGWQPPGADDETPDWWPACHPTRTAAGHQEPPQSGRPPAGVPAADSRSENRTPRDPDSCSENRMPPCDPDSCSENRILGVDPEDRVWAAAQADALHLRSVLSADVLPADRCACGGRL